MTPATTHGAVSAAPAGAFALEPAPAGRVTLRLSGDWHIGSRFPSFSELRAALTAQPGTRQLDFETGGLTVWDSGFLTVILKLLQYCKQVEVAIDLAGLPVGAQKLLYLATAVPERQGARRTAGRDSFLVRVGKETMSVFKSAGEMSAFLGEACIAFSRLLRGKARFRLVDLAVIVQECGANALPIVTLISILIGLILAFVGAIQLRQFGAQIYVADLVGIAMAREMGAIMTAIIMAGRTGAAFAAQLGTMQVNEEIDAFTTLGFSPMEFLVLPRMLALILMMPLLCVYADVLGILGGAIVGVGLLDITPTEYYVETIHGVGLTDFAIGIFKSAIFGVVVAIAGCLRGIQSGRSASAVGEAATSAVVMAIVLIIVLDGIFAVVTDVLGI
jgi:phospholipid/cholesterol/gamma-HCH transport system permease protein